MAEESRSQLKTYFETGDKPTQGQFANFIDSCYNKADDDLEAVIKKDEKTKGAAVFSGDDLDFQSGVNNHYIIVIDASSPVNIETISNAYLGEKLLLVEGGGALTFDEGLIPLSKRRGDPDGVDPEFIRLICWDTAGGGTYSLEYINNYNLVVL